MASPRSTLPNTQDEQDKAYNPGEQAYQEKMGAGYVGSGVDQAEAFANDPNNATKDVKSAEEKGNWDTNLSEEPKKKPVSFRARFKKAGPIIGIITALVGGGGAFSILGAPTFMFQSINGNLYSRIDSMLSTVTEAQDNILVGKIFVEDGGVNNSCKDLPCTSKGLTELEVAELQERGAVFNPEDGYKRTNGKYSFNSIQVEGVTITKTNFKASLANSAPVRKLMKPFRSATWNFLKTAVAASVRTKNLKITLNPDISGKSQEDINKKVFAVSTGSRAAPNVSTPELDTEGLDDDAKVAAEAERERAAGAAANFADQIAEQRAKAATGVAPSTVLDGGNIASVIEQGSAAGEIDIEAGRPAWKNWFGYVNTLDGADLICSVYQLANTASVIARTVALTNVVRYGYIFISIGDKIAAGDATQEEVAILGNILTTPDPLGRAFDGGGAMQWLFTGKLSGDAPTGVSAVGSDALKNIYISMHTIHALVGGVAGGSSSDGRAILNNTCAIATNLALQIAVTVVDLAISVVAGIFTGGSATVLLQGLKIGATTAIKTGVKLVIKKVVAEFAKDAAEKITVKSALKTTARNAKKVVRGLATDPTNVAFAMIMLVQWFGMDYITQALAGSDVLNMMKSGSQTGDAIVTAYSTTDVMTSVATGGSVQSVADYTSAKKVNDAYIAANIQDLKDEANPLDINNPYSKIAMFTSSLVSSLNPRTTTGVDSFAANTIASLSLPSAALSSLGSSAYADDLQEATAENLSTYNADPYFIEEGISNDIVGNPGVSGDSGYIREHTPEEVIGKMIESNQLQADGKTIVAGSSYEKHVNECNNPGRVQVDGTLFSGEFESQLYPESCRSDKLTVTQKLYNAATTYRTLLADTKDVIGWIPTVEDTSSSITENYDALVAETLAKIPAYTEPTQSQTSYTKPTPEDVAQLRETFETFATKPSESITTRVTARLEYSS